MFQLQKLYLKSGVKVLEKEKVFLYWVCVSTCVGGGGGSPIILAEQ